MEAFVEWPKPNHFHAEPPMIGRDSVRSCLDFYHKCARQWAGSHLDPKQGNDGQDGRRIANRGGSSQVSWNRVLGYSDAGWCWWLQMCDTRDKILQDTIFIWLLKAKRVFSSFAKTCSILFQNKEESTMEGICRRRADNADTTYAPAKQQSSIAA